MKQEITFTGHCVDNDSLSPDDAMDAFRRQFPLTKVNVHEDGKTMIYRLKHTSGAQSWLKQANAIINTMNLPLEANIEEWRSHNGSVVFEVNLEIKYRD